MQVELDNILILLSNDSELVLYDWVKLLYTEYCTKDEVSIDDVMFKFDT
jgi:hypothetical protein